MLIMTMIMLTMICSFQTGLQAARREDLGKCSANRQKLRGLSRHSLDDVIMMIMMIMMMIATIMILITIIMMITIIMIMILSFSPGCDVPCNDDVRRRLLGIYRGDHHLHAKSLSLFQM